MARLIAVKRVGRNAPGAEFSLPAGQARAIVLLGLATYAPEVKVEKPKVVAKAADAPVSKRAYQRRDMVAIAEVQPRGLMAVPADKPDEVKLTPAYYRPKDID